MTLGFRHTISITPQNWWPTVGSRAFLTIGRQGVSAFDRVKSVSFLVRSIDPPSGTLPPDSQLLLARGPFDIEAEVDLMRTHSIDVVITKNSGGEQTYAKIAAARQLSIPVIVVRTTTDPGDRPGIRYRSRGDGLAHGFRSWNGAVRPTSRSLQVRLRFRDHTGGMLGFFDAALRDRA